MFDKIRYWSCLDLLKTQISVLNDKFVMFVVSQAIGFDLNIFVKCSHSHFSHMAELITFVYLSQKSLALKITGPVGSRGQCSSQLVQIVKPALHTYVHLNALFTPSGGQYRCKT